MNGEKARIWKVAVMAYFKVLSWNLPGGTENPQKISGRIKV
jgi:hypothetical protein